MDSKTLFDDSFVRNKYPCLCKLEICYFTSFPIFCVFLFFTWKVSGGQLKKARKNLQEDRVKAQEEQKKLQALQLTVSSRWGKRL